MCGSYVVLQAPNTEVGGWWLWENIVAALQPSPKSKKEGRRGRVGGREERERRVRDRGPGGRREKEGGDCEKVAQILSGIFCTCEAGMPLTTAAPVEQQGGRRRLTASPERVHFVWEEWQWWWL